MSKDEYKQNLSREQSGTEFLKNFQLAEAKIDKEFKAGILCIARDGKEQGTEFCVLMGGKPDEIIEGFLTALDRLALQFPDTMAYVMSWVLSKTKDEVAQEIVGILTRHETAGETKH